MKFYALHKITTITGGATSGTLEYIVEPVFSNEMPKPKSVQKMNNEKYAFNTLVRTTYYKTRDEVKKTLDEEYEIYLKINQTKEKNDKKLITFPDVVYVEEAVEEGIDSLPYTKNDIRAFMHLHNTSYSIALLRLLCINKPALPLQFFGTKKNYGVFWAINIRRNYSYFDLTSNMNKYFKILASEFDIPVETFILSDEDFYNKKPSLDELMKTYTKINGEDIALKFEKNEDEAERKYLINRYIAINCVAMSNNTTPSGLGTANGLTRQMISKYLLTPNSSSVSKNFKEKVNNLLIALNSDVKDYL